MVKFFSFSSSNDCKKSNSCKVLYELLTIPHRSWFISEHIITFDQIMVDIIEYKLTNVIVLKGKNLESKSDAVILHSCCKKSLNKFRCQFYSKHQSETERIGKTNMNLLKSMNNCKLFFEIKFQLHRSKDHPYNMYESIESVFIWNKWTWLLKQLEKYGGSDEISSMTFRCHCYIFSRSFCLSLQIPHQRVLHL